MPFSNHARAARAAEALGPYLNAPELDDATPLELLVEAMVDICHYASLMGVHPPELLHCAGEVFQGEVLGTDRARPLHQRAPDLHQRIIAGDRLSAAEWAQVSDLLGGVGHAPGIPPEDA